MLTHRGEIQELERTLEQLSKEKQSLEHEFARIPAGGAKSVAQKRQREEIEANLEVTDRQISHVKQKLRHFQALNR